MIAECPPFLPHRSEEAYVAYRLLARLTGARSPRALPEPIRPASRPGRPAVDLVSRETIECAEDAVRGRVRVFAHEVQMADMRVWHADPVSAYAWPSDRPIRLFPEAGPPGALRRVWELNRMSWLQNLGWAYRATGRPVFLSVGWQHIHGWIAANPPGCGINWTSPLEMALRVLSWLGFVSLTGSCPPRDARSFWNSVHAQTRWTAWHLSLKPRPHNHLAGEALLLVAVGTLCPWMRGADSWIRLGRDAMDWGIDGCILTDGAPAEGSLNYAVFAMDAYSAAERLLATTRRRLPQRVRLRMEAGRRILQALDRLPSLPPMGDSDDMTLGPLVQAFAGTTMATGGIMEGSDEPSAVEPARPIRRASLDTDSEDVRCGSFVMATRGPFTVLCAVGKMGLAPRYGHAHAHALSVQFWFRGEPVLMDPGTYSYAEQPWRDYFRSTAAHCTVEVDGASQAVSVSDFAWRAPYTCCVTSRSQSGAFELRGSHDGYRRLSQRVGHSRRLRLTDRGLETEDSLSGRGPFMARLHWHIHPSWQPAGVDDTGLVLVKGPDALRLNVRGPGSLVLFRGSLAPLLGWWSPAFECREPATTLRVEARDASIRWLTEVAPWVA